MNETATCENCGVRYMARQTGQRFHSRECGLEYFQQEKRDAVAFYRRYRAEQVETAEAQS